MHSNKIKCSKNQKGKTQKKKKKDKKNSKENVSKIQKLTITVFNFYKQLNRIGYDKIIPSILARSARHPSIKTPKATHQEGFKGNLGSPCGTRKTSPSVQLHQTSH